MTSLVQVQHAPNGGANSFTCPIVTTANNTLVMLLTCWPNSAGGALATITDTASNAWTFSTLATNQNPPVGQSLDVAQSSTGIAAIACCIKAAAVTSVTVTLTGAIGYGEPGFLEFAGLPAGASILAAASSSALQSGVTAFQSPALTGLPAGTLVVANCSAFTAPSGVSGGFAQVSYTDPLGAYNLAASGTSQASWTGTSTDVPSSAIMAIGAAAAGGGGSPPAPSPDNSRNLFRKQFLW